MSRKLKIRSDISRSTPTTITIKGLDLCADLLGKVSVGDMAFLEIKDRLPTEAESIMFNAMMVSLVEHGITPSSIAARMTYAGAPEAMQAAIAAGLGGLGSNYVGSMENAARLLQESDAGITDLRSVAVSIVDRCRSENRQIPGIGHGLHKPVDPRAVKLIDLAGELGFAGRYTAIMALISKIATEQIGKPLPVNATGAIAAVASQMGIPWKIVRGIGVSARAIGLLGHIKEEIENPMALAVKTFVAEAAEADA